MRALRPATVALVRLRQEQARLATAPLQARFRASGAAASAPSARKSARAHDAPTLSVDDALYLATEAGYFTTREMQLQIVRSPPFSPRERPFLIENFFEVPYAQRSGDGEQLPGESSAAASGAPGAAGDADRASSLPVPAEIHGTILRHFSPEAAATFMHGGQEWLSWAEGRGTRKRASAHAVIVRGSGVIKINGEEDLYSRWPLLYNRFDVVQPFKLTGTSCAFDVFLDVRGGGSSGQSGAARLAIARALLMANPACHDDLQRGFCLLEDTRQKLSKMPGKKGKRSSFTWNKR
eukprot:TRINITY_DN27628_c0_g2_i1.p1 TRINITY_DN27628_c0_g2~~TRINITY_DN27628_c0_g2_i1.p1  ORF type:complete len:309 (+),score=59.79 TRINITY_DN27628_c0_g2_i1:46-927(+)